MCCECDFIDECFRFVVGCLWRNQWNTSWTRNSSHVLHFYPYITVWFILIWCTVARFGEQLIYIYIYIYNMDRLHKLQKKAIRIICSENRFAHSGPLMKELGVLNVKNIYNYLAGQFMFRYMKKLLPNLFESYFTLSPSVHTYNTRQQS